MSKRMRLLGVLAFLFPLLFQFLSPVIPVEGLLDNGYVVGSICVFAAQFVLSIFFGRFFCGWICPGGAYQETFCSCISKNNVNPKVNIVKYIVWIIWIIALMIITIIAGGITRVHFFYNTYFIRTIDVWGYYFAIYMIVSAVIFLCVLFAGKRGFCHVLCWMAPFMVLGGKLGKKLNVYRLRLTAKSSACTKCKRCNSTCSMGLDVLKMVETGTMSNTECILCGKCVTECPKDVIQFKFSRE